MQTIAAVGHIYALGMAQSIEGKKLISLAVKKIVEDSGMRVRDIAASCPMDRTYLYAIMNGTKNPTIDIIDRILQVCGVDFQQWLEGQSPQGPYKSLHEDLDKILKEGSLLKTVADTMEGWRVIAIQRKKKAGSAKKA